MRNRIVIQVIEFFFRLGLGVLFIYSSLEKISDPGEFANSVDLYEILPDFTIGLFSLTMPMLELLAGLAMLFTRWLRESALLMTGMLVMFIAALAQALARGLEISCGCFGVPDVGGRKEILIALVRDLVLIVPAAWLMFRPNVWIEPMRRMSKRWRIICLCAFGTSLVAWFIKDSLASGAFASSLSPQKDGVAELEQNEQIQGILVSSGPIRPGVWNADFKGVLAKAESEQLPMVLLYVKDGCVHCTRLEESIAGETFRMWREDRLPLMAFVRDKSPMSSQETVKSAKDFVLGINKDLKNIGYPFVCVYWPQAGITNQVAFSGRRGIMGGRKDRLLVVEFMSALDRALGERQTMTHKTLESMVQAATVQISARVESIGGTVSIKPEDGLLQEGEKVELVAHPNTGYVLLDWRSPDGSLASQEPHLTVLGGMPAGCYTARFRVRTAEDLKAEAARREAEARKKAAEAEAERNQQLELLRQIREELDRQRDESDGMRPYAEETGRLSRPASDSRNR